MFEFDVRVRKVRGFCSSSSLSSNLKNNMFEFEVRVREKFLFDPSLLVRYWLGAQRLGAIDLVQCRLGAYQLGEILTWCNRLGTYRVGAKKHIFCVNSEIFFRKCFTFFLPKFYSINEVQFCERKFYNWWSWSIKWENEQWLIPCKTRIFYPKWKCDDGLEFSAN